MSTQMAQPTSADEAFAVMAVIERMSKEGQRPRMQWISFLAPRELVERSRELWPGRGRSLALRTALRRAVKEEMDRRSNA